ncbi:MAG TPA: hypothetical protein DIW46_08895 [Microbacterium sp.]|nr:hypothetical protein [Microbacterium sp.]
MTAGVRAVVVDDMSGVRECAAIGIEASLEQTPDIDAEWLYGLRPEDATTNELTIPLQLVGRVMSTKAVEPGDGVSYGYTHRVVAPTVLALVTGGYAQGVVRALGNNASVEIAGVLHPIVGRVAMDVCVVDLETADADTAARHEGAHAIYFGGSGPARTNLSRWAEVTGMTERELVSVTGAKAVREWTS